MSQTAGAPLLDLSPRRRRDSLVVCHRRVGSADGHGEEQNVLGVRLPGQGVQQSHSLLQGQRTSGEAGQGAAQVPEPTSVTGVAAGSPLPAQLPAGIAPSQLRGCQDVLNLGLSPSLVINYQAMAHY